LKKRKVVGILTLLFFMLACCNPIGLASPMSDIAGHWAEASIVKMVDQGIISGYPDGTFKPEGKITRAEFASLLVRGFQLPIGGSKVFSDTANHWAKDFIAAAYSQGIISGYSEYEFGPDDPITREQMAVMIVKAARPDADVEGKTFADNNSIADWARQAVIIATGNNIISGYPDNTFRPKGNTTRAEAAVVLNQTLSLKTPVDETPILPEEDFSFIDEAGTYGPAAGTKTVEGSVTVESPDVTLRNLIISGDLIIAEEVGDGDVALDNVTVKGKTYIRGGGKDSIHINGGQYNEIIIEQTATGAVRIVATDSTGLKVVISEKADGERIILEGNFKNVTVKAENVDIATQGETSIDDFKVESGLDDVKIEFSKDTVVNEINLNSTVDVKGEGTIKEASGSKAKESSFATEPGRVTAPPAGGGGGGSSSTAVSAISVDKEATTLPVGTSETLVVTFDPTNATNKNVTWSSSDEGVATVADGVVTAVTEGTATITATSNNGKTATTTVTVVHEDTVAMIGTTQYDSLREAVNVANDSKAEVIMIADVTIAGGSGGYGVAGLVLNGAIINGNGNTLTVTGANNTWNCAIYTTGGTIKNLTVGGAFRGIFTAGCSEDIIIDNVVLDNVCYTFSSDGSNPDYSVIVTNSTLNGWTSFTSGYKSVSFNDCIFGKGTGAYQYAYMRPYSDTAFSNCVFSEGYELDARQTDDITLYNCTVGGVKLTQDNLTTLLGANAAKAKVLTIEDDVYYYGTTLYGLTNEFTGTTLTVREGTTVIGAGALQDNSTIEEVVLPDGLITIEANAFKRCTNLETINLPNSLTSIGDQAFQQCSGLTSVVIPNSVTAIGNDAYKVCRSVTELVIPEGVTTIGIGAFRELAITEVTIPSTVTSLGSFAFRDCKQLRNVYFNCKSAPEITTTGSANGQVFRVMDGSGNVVIKITNEDVYNTVTAVSYAFRGCYIDDSHHVSCVYTEQVVEGVLLTGTKTYEIISKAGLMNLDTVLAGADLGEGKAATINLAVDVDLTGETWTPISRMWFTFNGNGHTISNLTTESTRKAGLFGYAGAVTVNDLTLENVTVTGSQAGAFAGAGEGFTANNCFLKGTNTVNFTPTEETWNGIGAITGVLLNGTVNVTIDKDATVTLNRGDMTTAEGCVYVDDLTGHITTNKGTVTVEENGTVVATGSYPYSAAEDTVETQQDVAEAVEALEAAVSTFNDAKQEVIDEEEIGVPGEGEESVQAEEPAEDEKSVEDEEAVEGEEQEE